MSEEIPYGHTKAEGHLSRMDNLFPPREFQIKKYIRGRLYYLGQLFYRYNSPAEQWHWVAYSNYEQELVAEMQEYLGNVVELWYE